MKKNKEKNSVLIFLCITILSLVLGFVFLSFKIKEVKESSSYYKVIFSNIEKVSSIKGGKIEPVSSANIILDGHEVEMDFELNDIHDEVVYSSSIKNKSNTPVKIIDIIKSSNRDDNYPINLEIINENSKIIEAGEEIIIKFRITYKKSKEEVSKKSIKYKLGIITESK